MKIYQMACIMACLGASFLFAEQSVIITDNDYFVIRRVTATTDYGIVALNPGKKIQVQESLTNNMVRILSDDAEFVVSVEDISNDSEIVKSAVEADRQAISETHKELQAQKESRSSLRVDSASQATSPKRETQSIQNNSSSLNSNNDAEQQRREQVRENAENGRMRQNELKAEQEAEKIRRKKYNDMKQDIDILQKEIDILTVETKTAFDVANAEGRSRGVKTMEASQKAHAKQSLLRDKKAKLSQLRSQLKQLSIQL